MRFLFCCLLAACVSSRNDTPDVPETTLSMGCNNSSTWSAFWFTEQDLGRVDLVLVADGQERSSSSTSTCGELMTDLPCTLTPAAVKLEVFNLSSLACVQTSSDGASAWASSACPWGSEYRPCGGG